MTTNIQSTPKSPSSRGIDSNLAPIMGGALWGGFLGSSLGGESGGLPGVLIGFIAALIICRIADNTQSKPSTRNQA